MLLVAGFPPCMANPTLVAGPGCEDLRPAAGLGMPNGNMLLQVGSCCAENHASATGLANALAADDPQVIVLYYPVRLHSGISRLLQACWVDVEVSASLKR